MARFPYNIRVTRQSNLTSQTVEINIRSQLYKAQILAVCLQNITPIDWKEVKRLAACPSFGILKEVKQLRKEVADELKKQA